MTGLHPDEVVLLRVASEGAVTGDGRVLLHVAQCGRCRALVRYVGEASAALRRGAPELDDETRADVLMRVMRTIGEVTGVDTGLQQESRA